MVLEEPSFTWKNHPLPKISNRFSNFKRRLKMILSTDIWKLSSLVNTSKISFISRRPQVVLLVLFFINKMPLEGPFYTSPNTADIGSTSKFNIYRRVSKDHPLEDLPKDFDKVHFLDKTSKRSGITYWKIAILWRYAKDRETFLVIYRLREDLYFKNGPGGIFIFWIPLNAFFLFLEDL